ncbi:MAG: ArsR/SmtB family transcription factor [Candidatus Dormibacteria bacterium]
MVGSATRTAALPRVESSAPMELLWLGHILLGSSGNHLAPPDELRAPAAAGVAQRLRSFWGDGISGGAAELAIMADQSGQLFTTDLDRLLADPPAPDPDPTGLRLASEDPADRRRMIERLGRLARDRRLRRRYTGLLNDLWQPLRPGWERIGLPQVRARCAAITEQLERGLPLEEVAPVLADLTRKDATWRRLVDEAADRGRLALVPSHFGGPWSLWDFPNHVTVGFLASSAPRQGTREAGRRLAPRLRALGDPTRLDLLFHIAQRPTSVGELAGIFDLAQPTVSAHLRVLREAALVTGERRQGRTIYAVDRGQLDQLLKEVGQKTALDSDS